MESTVVLDGTELVWFMKSSKDPQEGQKTGSLSLPETYFNMESFYPVPINATLTKYLEMILKT